jgi:hypothetical protein
MSDCRCEHGAPCEACRVMVCHEGHRTRRPKPGERQWSCGCVAFGLNPDSERRIREMIREELAAYFASMSRSTTYAEWLRDRDEPPAVPPVRVVNTTERL